MSDEKTSVNLNPEKQGLTRTDKLVAFGYLTSAGLFGGALYQASVNVMNGIFPGLLMGSILLAGSDYSSQYSER